MLEYRFFFPLDESLVNELDFVLYFTGKQAKNPERRKDTYILFGNVEYGLKVRSSDSRYPLLELKVRGRVIDGGTFFNFGIKLISIFRYRTME